MKSHSGSRSTQFHTFFDLDNIWRWGVSYTPRLLYPQGKSPWYQFDRRLGGLRSGGEEKNSQPLPGLEYPIIQPVAQCYTSEVSRLLCMLHAPPLSYSLLDHPNNTWWSVQVMKLLITQSSPISRHFLPLRSKYFTRVKRIMVSRMRM
jgi:hypothetical protein